MDPSLRDPTINPNIINNRHLRLILLEIYLDSGGATVLPLQPGRIVQ
jgi:hypothetical protein